MNLQKNIRSMCIALSLTLAAVFSFAALPGHFGTVHAQDGFKIYYNFGLERGDYKDFDLSRAAWEDCRDACAAESACLAFTYTIPIAGAGGRPAHCWLKNVVNRGEGRDWCTSGVKEGAVGCGTNDYGVQAPGVVAAGSTFKVQFSTRGPKPTGHSDWIGIIIPGKKEYRDWRWVSDISGCEVTLTAPGPGYYEVQYILAGDSWPVAARVGIQVQ